jgi:glucose/arabinose dehydrogenase
MLRRWVRVILPTGVDSQAPAPRTRLSAVLLAMMLVAACSSGSKPRTAASPSASPTPTQAATATPATPTPTPQPRAPGQLNLGQQTIAQDLVAPWAIDFAKDGSIWFTERPGRVRVIRNGQLLPDPALTLSVATAGGCEDGLLGIALKDPYAYLYYTYRGSGGNTNRVSRFTISGDKLSGEQVIVGDIPGGTCYHFGGRLKFGPDGLLYLTTGEGFVASRAADPNNLSGKVIRVHEDGSGREIYAWGFRNPQGLAFDSQGRLYASNNGPTGDLGLCCHDEIDLLRQGGFYGWPAWAANTRTSYQGSLPARVPPLVESGSGVAWAPSGMTFYTPSRDEQPTLLVATLKGQALRRFILDPSDPSRVIGQETILSGDRLRDAAANPNDGCLYVLTNNRDTRGSPKPGDDRIIKLCPR